MENLFNILFSIIFMMVFIFMLVAFICMMITDIKDSKNLRKSLQESDRVYKETMRELLAQAEETDQSKKTIDKSSKI